MFASAGDNEISMAHVLLEGVSKHFGPVTVIKHLDLRIEDREPGRPRKPFSRTTTSRRSGPVMLTAVVPAER
jgi:hypothetical protein